MGDPAAATRGGTELACDNGDLECSASTSAASSWSGAPPIGTSAPLFDRIDLLVDGNAALDDRRRRSLRRRLPRGPGRRDRQRPFRVVPFFDPGAVGRAVDEGGLRPRPAAPNYAWCFDCVPEENSLLLGSVARCRRDPGDRPRLHPSAGAARRRPCTRASAPSSPSGSTSWTRWAAATSRFQVHPLTRVHPQTRSACPTRRTRATTCSTPADDAVVYLGLKTGVDPDEMLRANCAPPRTAGQPSTPRRTSTASRRGSTTTSSSRPARCTARARTPWCWRSARRRTSSPSSCGTGAAWAWTASRGRSTSTTASTNIQWDRDTDVGRAKPGRPRRGRWRKAPGWGEERTGLHELEFIETRRHWFTGRSRTTREGTVNVLNLVEGEEADREPDRRVRAVHASTTRRRSSFPRPWAPTSSAGHPTPAASASPPSRRTCGERAPATAEHRRRRVSTTNRQLNTAPQLNIASQHRGTLPHPAGTHLASTRRSR